MADNKTVLHLRRNKGEVVELVVIYVDLLTIITSSTLALLCLYTVKQRAERFSTDYYYRAVFLSLKSL